MKQLIVGAALCLMTVAAASSDTVLPSKITQADISGEIFARPGTIKETHNGNAIEDITTLLSSDKKFASGMYKSGKSHWVIDEPYGVDEFMYFIEGGVTLTSLDGTVTEIKAGEAVTIPKEWTGTWDTEGYTKIWVIYSADGSGL